MIFENVLNVSVPAPDPFGYGELEFKFPFIDQAFLKSAYIRSFVASNSDGLISVANKDGYVEIRDSVSPQQPIPKTNDLTFTAGVTSISETIGLFLPSSTDQKLVIPGDGMLVYSDRIYKYVMFFKMPDLSGGAIISQFVFELDPVKK